MKKLIIKLKIKLSLLMFRQINMVKNKFSRFINLTKYSQKNNSSNSKLKSIKVMVTRKIKKFLTMNKDLLREKGIMLTNS